MIFLPPSSGHYTLLSLPLGLPLRSAVSALIVVSGRGAFAGRHGSGSGPARRETRLENSLGFSQRVGRVINRRRGEKRLVGVLAEPPFEIVDGRRVGTHRNRDAASFRRPARWH